MSAPALQQRPAPERSVLATRRWVAPEDARLCDLTCERALLGALVLHPEQVAPAVAAGLGPRDFAAPGNGAVFAALVRLGAGRSSDALVSSVIAELHRAGELGVAGGRTGVVGFVLDALEPHLIGAAFGRVMMLGRARLAQRALRQALDAIERDPAQAHRALAGIEAVA